MTINRDPLRAMIHATGKAAFAVLDGARFDDLPQALRDADILDGRCLYLDLGHDNPDAALTAPWLIGPLTDRSLEAVADLLDAVGSAAGVFWICPDGGDVLFRHLRGINMVRILGPRDLSVGEEELVLFRHCDANVLAQVIPEFDASQRLRFMGPAAMVASFPDPRWGRPSRLLRGEGRAPPGLLTLTQDTIARIDAARRAALNRHVVAYLRRTLPLPLRDKPEAELSRAVDESIGRATDHGVTGDGSHCRWAYLHVLTGGAIATDAEVARFMKGGASHATPDQRVRQLMEAMIYRLREGV